MKRLGFLIVVVLILTGCSENQAIQPGQSSAKIPIIPHEVSQNMDCLGCHKTGANGAKVTPHPDRPNCTSCHKSNT